MTNIITKDSVFVQYTKFINLLLTNNNYKQIHDNINNYDKDFDMNKTYEIAFSGFVDFNQHLYEDINHLNSINAGIFIEKSLIVYKIFVWSSVGQGFEIFKHILRVEELEKLNTEEDVKDYIITNLLNLQSGINKTYVNNSFEEFGKGIESMRLPLNSILQDINLENNMNDF